MTEYYGSIVKKELQYDGFKRIIPVSAVPLGKIGKFYVTARNDMSSSQPIGIYWFVADPDGEIAEEYVDWKIGTLGYGQTHEFKGDNFSFSKLGKYTTWIDLIMGSEGNPVVVYSARFIGEVCMVVSAEVPSEPAISMFEITDYSTV